MAKRLHPMAPYFVQMRELERRLILSALDQSASPSENTRIQTAASLLGVHFGYLRVRARVLGGVLDGDPKHEPPISTATEQWSRETVRGTPKPPRQRRVKEAEPDA